MCEIETMPVKFLDSGISRQDIRTRFGLQEYHLLSMEACNALGSLRGQRVLEIGGSLPKGLVLDILQAKQWISIEDFDYWNEIASDAQSTRPNQIDCKFADAPPPQSLPAHSVLRGKIEDLPATFSGQFDRIFSVACFEHIHNLGYALEKMHESLKSEGNLFSIFSPIWSAHNGNHLPLVTDQKGSSFSFEEGKSPLFPWAHLMFSPPEMFQFLIKHTDSATAGKMVYYIYHSPHINRLFCEDYISYFNHSKFSKLDYGEVDVHPVDPIIIDRLKQRHPPYEKFTNNGMVISLGK